jgi:hypothetical protein
MMELRELLQSKLGWIETTRGQTHVNVKLSREDLATLVDLLAPTELVGSSLPKYGLIGLPEIDWVTGAPKKLA